jgi:hypothetical protein
MLEWIHVAQDRDQCDDGVGAPSDRRCLVVGSGDRDGPTARSRAGGFAPSGGASPLLHAGA